MQKLSPKRAARGVTLIEFVTIIAIISIISVTIGISLSTLTPRKLENQVQKLVADLTWARAMAISTHYHYRVDFDIDSNGLVNSADNNTYIIYKIDPADPVNETVVKLGMLRVDSINLTHSPAATPVVFFDFMNPQGGLNTTISDPLTIQLQLSGSGNKITVRNLTGHISWERL